MEFQNTRVILNKNKAIGKVLFIVEGGWTEPYILRRIFTTIFDYQFETILRDKGYKQYNSKDNPYSQVFVINTEESNIKHIARDNKFLTELFKDLITNYDFDVDNAAIYYIFDRDNKSNTDTKFIENMLDILVNSRDNPGYDRQGMLLFSYPSIESFTVSNYIDNTLELKFDTGHSLKIYTSEQSINHQKICENSLIHATEELLHSIEQIGVSEIDVDNFGLANKSIYFYEEEEYNKESLYRVLSLLSVALIDLGLIEIDQSYQDVG